MLTLNGREVTNPWARVVGGIVLALMALLSPVMIMLAIAMIYAIFAGIFFGTIVLLVFFFANFPDFIAALMGLLLLFAAYFVVLLIGHYALRKLGRNGFMERSSAAEGRSGTWWLQFKVSRDSFQRRGATT